MPWRPSIRNEQSGGSTVPAIGPNMHLPSSLASCCHRCATPEVISCTAGPNPTTTLAATTPLPGGGLSPYSISSASPAKPTSTSVVQRVFSQVSEHHSENGVSTHGRYIAKPLGLAKVLRPASLLPKVRNHRGL